MNYASVGSLISKEVNGASIKKNEFTDAGIPVVPKKAISNNSWLDQSTFVYTSGDFAEKNPRSVISRSHLVTTLRNLNPDGSTLGLVCENKSGDGILLAQGLYGFELKGNVHPRYLCYASRTDDFRRQVMRIKVGSTQVHIRARELKEIKVPLPSLPEQKRITTILDKADAIRRKNQYAIQLTDDFLRAVFLDMFGDSVMNPKGWGMKPIKELGNVITGATPPSKKEGMFGNDIPFVTPGDLGSNVSDVNRSLSHEGALNSRICRAGSLMACCIGATIGKVAIANTQSTFNQQINSVEWFEDINDYYGYFLFRIFPGLITKNAIKTTLPILKKSLFEKIMIPVPDIDLQDQFENTVKTTWKLKSIHKKRLDFPLFESLSQRAFAGAL